MNKPEWLLTSSDRGETWRIQSGRILIILTNHHIDYRGLWVMHCNALNIDTLPLNATNSDDAKSESLQIIKQKLDELNQNFQYLN